MRVAIPAKGLVIGRDPKQVDLVVSHILVSRKHAQVASGKDGKLYLIDLQSRNGTYVNGHKLSAPVPLQPNDKIEFGTKGKVVFLFESADTTSVSGVLKEAFGETVAPVEWKVGDTILGIYEVTGLLGQGGFGKVYKVHHKSWNMDLAVKSPLPELFTDEEAVAKFIREAETWVNLNLHPNIVQCHYVRTIGGIPRIFAEHVGGGNLRQWIKHKKLSQLDQILDVAIQFAWGLHAAHEQGIVHQDVKPANILMAEDGCPKVADFGLARSRPASTGNIPAEQSDLVSFAGGTMAYISPEQAKGEKLSRKTDIWSWAVSVLEMFTGGIVWKNGLQAPEVLKTYHRLLGPKFLVKMPKEVAALLAKCLRLSPQDRPRDMLEIAGTLTCSKTSEDLTAFYRRVLREVLVQIVVCIDFIKHPRFESEREQRIIMNPNDGTFGVQNIRHYDRNGTTVPYLFFDLRDPHTGCLPLTEIIVGPNATFPDGIAFVEQLLDDNRYGDIGDSGRPRVIQSSISPWGETKRSQGGCR